MLVQTITISNYSYSINTKKQLILSDSYKIEFYTLKLISCIMFSLGELQTKTTNKIMNSFLNCWEAKECGREPGGKNVELYGLCSVPEETACNGLNGGENGGRSCWLWRETACTEIMKKSSVQNIRECRECNFYIAVKKTQVTLLWKKFCRTVGK